MKDEINEANEPDQKEIYQLVVVEHIIQAGGLTSDFEQYTILLKVEVK